MTLIVWNGCDGYIEADKALAHGYDFDGSALYHGVCVFSAFEVSEVDQESLPKDSNGDLVVDNVFYTETGHFYLSK